MTQRSNEEWLQDLRSEGHAREEAVKDLRNLIARALPYALSPYLTDKNPRFQPLVEEVVQETLIRVLDRMDTFEGRSQFATWVNKIAIRLAFTELRRKRWENISLESLLENPDNPPPPLLVADPEPHPEKVVEVSDLVRQVEQIIAEELTEKQRMAIEAVAFHGMPMEEAARWMGTNRNALYKLLHDTRLRIKKRLEERSLNPKEVLAVFEEK
jgi:RNA polymerase sigma-70 factor (ECF subfamily)